MTDELVEWDDMWLDAATEEGARTIAKAVILDDQLGEKMPKSVLQLFNRGRKLGFTSVFITSSMKDTDKRLRNNMSYVNLCHLDITRDAKTILMAYSLPPAIIDIYRQITSTKGQWLMIDNTPAAMKNPALRVRCCYEPIVSAMKLLVKPPPKAKGRGKQEEEDEWESDLDD